MNNRNDIRSLLRFRSTPEKVHDLLEDFEVISTDQHTALIPRYFHVRALSENVMAAVIAASYGLSSIDYAKKRYHKSEAIDESLEARSEKIQYIRAYVSAKKYISRMIHKFSHEEDLPPPSSGVFGASIVLERLQYSFFCAHLLYSLGHRYEGHSVSRLILEQIAWAHAACRLETLEEVQNIVTTKTISNLKATQPIAGRLYGFLSQKTHIDYKSHIDFLHAENGKNAIRFTQNEFHEYAEVILYLADLYGIVWELSQYQYLTGLEAVMIHDGGYSIKEDRPFLKTIGEHLRNIEIAANQANSADAESDAAD